MFLVAFVIFFSNHFIRRGASSIRHSLNFLHDMSMSPTDYVFLSVVADPGAMMAPFTILA